MNEVILNPPLEDAIVMSVLNDTFKVPDDMDIRCLKPGDFIKVCAKGERFWCIIKQVQLMPVRMFLAEVNNDLAHTELHHLKLGDLMFVQPYNIYDIEND